MKIFMKKAVGVSLLTAFLAAGCGKPDPEKLIAEAQKSEAKGDIRAALVNLKSALQEQPENVQARLQLAALYLRTGDVSLADIELGKAEQQRAEPSKVLELRARSALVSRKFNEAIALLAPDKSPFVVANPDLLALRGDVLSQVNKLPEAEQSYQDALKIKSEHLQSLLGLVRLAHFSRNPELAQKRLEEAQHLYPKSAELELLRGDLALYEGKLDAAAVAYQKASELAPGRSVVFYNLALVNIQRQKLDEARKNISKVMALEPGSRFARYLTASINFQEKKYDAAQSSIQELLKLIPDDLSAKHLAASIAYAKGNYGVADSYMKAVLDKSPNNSQAQYLMAAILLKLNQPDQAIMHLKIAMKEKPDLPVLISTMGDALAMKGEYAAAVTLYERAAKLLPDSPMPKTKLAASHISAGDVNKGLDELESIRQLQQMDELSVSMLVLTAIKHQQYDRAQKAIDTALKETPKNPAILQLAAALAVAKNDVKAERNYLERAVAAKPDFVPAILALAGLERRQGNYDAGKKRLETFAAANAKNQDAQMILAEYLVNKPENAQAALKVFERAHKLNPAKATPAIRASQLALYLQNRNKALEYAQRALTANPDNAEAMENLGQIQLGLGDKNAALATFTKLVGLKPKASIVYVHLAKAQALLGDEASARNNLQKALSLDPNFIVAQKALLASLLRSGKTEQALAFAKQVQQLKPSAMYGLVYEGDVLARQKRFAEAAKAYQQSVEGFPSAETAIKLHAAQSYAGNLREADAVLAKWLQQRPREQIAQHYLAESYMRQSNWKAAIAQYQLILGLYARDVRALNNLANSQLSNGDLVAARATIEKAESYNVHDAEVLDTHATILAAAGDVNKALEKVEAALAESNASPSIRLHRAQLLIKLEKRDAARKDLLQVRALGDKFAGQAEVNKLLSELK